jgi:uncharacterized protein (TIGR02147 family)
MKMFGHTSYKDVLRDVIRHHRGQLGFKQRLARAAGCQPSLLSRVLHSHLHLTPDHVPGISSFLRLNESETEYFETLLHWERSGHPAYRRRLEAKMRRIREASQDLSKVFSTSAVDSADSQLFYYSSWVPAAVHIACAIRELRTAETIAKHLEISERLALTTLNRLAAIGLLRKVDAEFVISETFLHLNRESPLIAAHHSHWRGKAASDCHRRDPSSLHYSGVFAVGKEQFETIKEQFLASLESARDTVTSTDREQELICIAADVFRV